MDFDIISYQMLYLFDLVVYEQFLNTFKSRRKRLLWSYFELLLSGTIHVIFS